MTIRLRTDDLPDDAVVLVHLGAGATNFVIDAAVKNYPEYRHLTGSGLGLFAVSAFAAVRDVDVATIVTTMQRTRFGTATAGDIRSLFALLATSDDDSQLPEAVRRLQHVHFDIVLPAADDDRLAHIDPEYDPELLGLVRARLAGPVAELLELFLPRRRYDRAKGAS